jgi:VanZ family protein
MSQSPVVASPNRRPAWRITAALLLAALVLVFTYDVLAPRPDWHNAPIHLWPLKFRVKLGSLGADTLRHALTLAVLGPALVLLLRLPRTKRVARWVVACALGWSLLVELVQAFLPYRNSELSDVAANVFGSTLALVILRLLRRAATTTTAAIPARDDST